MGTQIAEYVQKNLKGEAVLFAVCDADPARAEGLREKMTPRPAVTSMTDLIKISDLIVEAASAGISGEIAEEAERLGKDVLIMSTGGLLKRPLTPRVHISSGAICGLDGLSSAGVGKIKSVTLTTRKPPQGLKGAPYLKEKNIDVEKIKKETLVFSGNAEDAIRHFPQNVNVAVTLSIRGIGPKDTMVRIFTSPEYVKNVHEVEVEGEFGRLFTRTENVPSRENPKTSQLAIFSAIAELKKMLNSEGHRVTRSPGRDA